MKPRVLYFINSLGIGGAELGLRTMLQNGLFDQVDLRVVLIQRGSEELADDVCRLVGRENLIVGGDGPKLTLSGSVTASIKLLYQIVTFRPDVVVLSLKQANIIGRSLLYLFPRIRCIAFEHIAHLEKGRAVRVYEWVLRALSGRVNEVWGDCNATLMATRPYYRGPARAETFAPLFVVPDDAPEKADYRLHNPIRIVVASRLVSRKRIDVLLRAARLLEEQGMAIELTIFGDGPDTPRLQQIISDLRLSSTITFAGFVKNWWRQAMHHDIFVHLSDDEGFCITVSEAMMVGLPVVASPVGGVVDYSQHAVDAWHMKSLDPADVAATLRDLTEGRKREELGRRAASSIRLQFGRASVYSHYKQIAATFDSPRTDVSLKAQPSSSPAKTEV